MTVSHEPTTIDLDRQQGLTIVWDDGVESRFGLEELRVNSTCAECRGIRDQGAVVWPKASSPQPLRAEGAELVGAWGLSVRWNDGHSTGIYAWDVLRAWSEQ
jgi:DUF971 family protein